MVDFLKRNTPPGINLKQMYHVFLFCNIGSVLYSFFAFIGNYLEAREELFTYIGAERIRIAGAIIAPFHNLLTFCFSGFIISAIVMLCFILYHYIYYRQGSMSIYLMKRLPKKSEIHRRAFTVPSLAVLAVIAIAIATIMFYYLIYLIATPKACLPYAALREIWR